MGFVIGETRTQIRGMLLAREELGRRENWNEKLNGGAVESGRYIMSKMDKCRKREDGLVIKEDCLRKLDSMPTSVPKLWTSHFTPMSTNFVFVQVYNLRHWGLYL